MSTQENKPKKHGFLAFLLATIGAIAVGAGVIIITYCVSSCKGTERAATNNDIQIDLSQEIALSINYKVTPKVDISDLQITFTYYNNKNQVIATKAKTIGNVTKNKEITVSVSLSEFSLTEIFTITSTSAQVTGGTVSYL